MSKEYIATIKDPESWSHSHVFPSRFYIATNPIIPRFHGTKILHPSPLFKQEYDQAYTPREWHIGHLILYYKSKVLTMIAT